MQKGTRARACTSFVPIDQAGSTSVTAEDTKASIQDGKNKSSHCPVRSGQSDGREGCLGFCSPRVPCEPGFVCASLKRHRLPPSPPGCPLPENLSAGPDFFQLDSLDGFTRHFKKTVFPEEAGGWHLLEMTHLGAIQDL